MLQQPQQLLLVTFRKSYLLLVIQDRVATKRFLRNKGISVDIKGHYTILSKDFCQKIQFFEKKKQKNIKNKKMK